MFGLPPNSNNQANTIFSTNCGFGLNEVLSGIEVVRPVLVIYRFFVNDTTAVEIFRIMVGL
jgi:hypothetical protein